MRRAALLWATLAALVLAAGCATPGAPGSPDSTAISGLCARPAVLSAADQDRMLRFAAQIRQVLADSGASVALIARAGLNLDRFDISLSHAGIALRDLEIPWSVRQLYFACDEGRPRLFDQGLGGFVINSDNPAAGRVSLVFLPEPAAAPLQRSAHDRSLALRLLAAEYSANAWAFSTRYQNCNQWVAELMAAAWGDLGESEDLRERAQRWLRMAGYVPTPVRLDSWWLRVAAGFVPLIHLDDHPDGEATGLSLATSLPASIEAFARLRHPSARRTELCHDGRQIVIRDGWEPIAAGCLPAPGDRVIPF